MSGICGWLGGAPAPGNDAERLAQMGALLARFDRSDVRVRLGGHGAVASASTPGDSCDVYADEERIVAICGRAAVEFAGTSGAHASPARTLADGYAARGADVLSAVSGAFALAIIDHRRGEALLATDRMGTHPLAFCVSGDRLVFGSSLDAIRMCLRRNAEWSPQAVYNYVYHHVVPAPESIDPALRRLLPGECAIFRDGAITVRRYWEMQFREDAPASFASLKDEFLAVLRASVRRAAEGGSVGAFLSGGTDSSTIAGLLSEATGAPARTYSIGFDAAGYDEMSFARIAATHFGTRHHEYYVTADDIVAAIPKIAAVHDQPFGNSSAIPAYFCARLAKDDGVDTMLGGDGGDELFGGNERYAKQYLYSLYGDLSPRLRGLIEPAAFVLPSVGIIGKAQRYMRHAAEPMPGRYENYNLLGRFGATRVFAPDFLADVNQGEPREAMERIYHDGSASSLINRMLALDLKYTLADNDLPKVSRSCELAGVSARYPLLDDAVVAFSSKLSPRLKLNRTRLRFFFKQALAGFLPDAIIAKTKHGFGLPFGLWVRTHPRLRAIALDSLTDLKGRRIFRPEFIDDLTSRHLEEHGSYYGTMIWVLMMLEQWFVRKDASQAVVRPAAPSAVAGGRVAEPGIASKS
jgi:asparagine synthase (glutamine-hydrolysing)